MADGNLGKRRAKHTSTKSEYSETDEGSNLSPSSSSAAPSNAGNSDGDSSADINANSGAKDGGDNGTNSNGEGLDNFLKRLDDISGTPAKTRALKKGYRKSSDISDGKSKLKGGKIITNISDTTFESDSDPSSSYTTITSSSALNTIIRKSLLLLTFLSLIYVAKRHANHNHLHGNIHNFVHNFLLWVQEHPGTGVAAFVVVYGGCVVLLLPGTPLNLGGGYVYKLSYGWFWGVSLATLASMAGSLLGSCMSFILGRYIMRDRVRKWGRKYPMFEAIDVAVSDNGFRIMCLLYLTPVLPLGPVAYLCGTTSMPLYKFAAAKIAALPLMFLYVFIGASTDTLLVTGEDDGGVSNGGEIGEAGSNAATGGNAATAKKINVGEDTHRKMVLFGLCLSIVSMTLVSHFVKKELQKIFDKQKRDKSDANYDGSGASTEMTIRNDHLSRRPRGAAPLSGNAKALDEERGG